MNMIKDGGPAFPFVSHGGVHEHQACLPGMTLRDYFAAKALNALICEPQWSNGGVLSMIGKLVPTLADSPANQTAAAAYLLADAMLAARKAQP